MKVLAFLLVFSAFLFGSEFSEKTLREFYRRDVMYYEQFKQDYRTLLRAKKFFELGNEKRFKKEIRKLRLLNARAILRDFEKAENRIAKSVFLAKLVTWAEKKLKELKPKANVRVEEYAIVLYKGISAPKVCKRAKEALGVEYAVKDNICYLLGFEDRDVAFEIARKLGAIGVRKVSPEEFGGDKRD